MNAEVEIRLFEAILPSENYFANNLKVTSFEQATKLSRDLTFHV
jgi:hypothetical protein